MLKDKIVRLKLAGEGKWKAFAHSELTVVKCLSKTQTLQDFPGPHIQKIQIEINKIV